MNKDQVVSDPVFISMEEASTKYGYHINYLYFIARKGKVATKKISNKLYISVQDLDERFSTNSNRVKKKSKVAKVKAVKATRKPRKTTSVKQTNNAEIGVLILVSILGLVIGLIFAGLVK